MMLVVCSCKLLLLGGDGRKSEYLDFLRGVFFCSKSESVKKSKL